MTHEEFLAKWAANVLNRNDEGDVLNETLHDEERPIDERMEEVCRFVIRRNLLDMMFDLGFGSLDVDDALTLLREWFVNSSPVVI